MRRQGQTFHLQQLLRLAVAMLLLSGPAGTLAETVRVLFVSSHTSSPYLKFIEQAQQALQTGNPVRTTTTTLSAEALAADETGSLSGYDLVVALGIQAARAVRHQQPDAPVLYALIPQASWQQLQQSGELHCPEQRCSAVFIDQPLPRLLSIISTAFGKPTRIGVLLGPTSAQQHEELSRLAASHKMTLVTEQVSDQADLLPALDRLLENSDLLLAVADPLIYNSRTTRSLLLTTYRYRVPMLAYSRAFVEAGAALAVYSTPRQIGRQSADIIATWLKNPQAGLPAPQYPSNYRVRINSRVADSLRLDLARNPDLLSIIRKADNEPADDTE
ncbi:MAG: ABC transporter substrate binding protein [Thiogranum sp.]|nr:ABC transporter substrate binding protein [Thiogranum sp.]